MSDNVETIDMSNVAPKEDNSTITYDLVADKEKLREELEKVSLFFRIEEGVTYKVKLNSTKVEKVEKEFEGDKSFKYQINITAKGSDKSEFTGIWEVGKSILEPIFKYYEEGVVFAVSKSGKGRETRYSVVKDF
jgi:hypothetical protein